MSLSRKRECSFITGDLVYISLNARLWYVLKEEDSHELTEHGEKDRNRYTGMGWVTKKNPQGAFLVVHPRINFCDLSGTKYTGLQVFSEFKFWYALHASAKKIDAK